LIIGFMEHFCDEKPHLYANITEINCTFHAILLRPCWSLAEKQLYEIQCVRKVAVHLQKVVEVMYTSVYTGLNPFNFIRKHFLQICVRKVAVHLQKMVEVMSTSVYTVLNPFNFIHKLFLQICVRKVAVHL
jgi:hypothetical protein